MEVETVFTGFVDRADGGRRLAEALEHYRGRPDTIVLGLPRGGVVTAAAIAESLHLPLDVLVVRKLGTPGLEELAMGAIGPGGVRALNRDVLCWMGVPADAVERAVLHEQEELQRREHLYRGDQPPLDLRDKTVILVDDGLATGATMSAALAVVRRQNPARVVLAVPVAAIETCERFRLAVDELVYLETPDPFRAVGYWYVDFAPVEDGEVMWLLQHARERQYAVA